MSKKDFREVDLLLTEVNELLYTKELSLLYTKGLSKNDSIYLLGVMRELSEKLISRISELPINTNYLGKKEGGK